MYLDGWRCTLRWFRTFLLAQIREIRNVDEVFADVVRILNNHVVILQRPFYSRV